MSVRPGTRFADATAGRPAERLVMVFPADQIEGGESSRPQINAVLNWFEELTRLVPAN